MGHSPKWWVYYYKKKLVHSFLPQLTGHSIDGHDPAQSGAVIDVFADIDLSDQCVILNIGGKVLLYLLDQGFEIMGLRKFLNSDVS